MSAVRHWCPERWVDETMPSGQTPDAFLSGSGQTWSLTDPADPSDFTWKELIVPGEVVAFAYWEKRGTFEITVIGDVLAPDDLPEGPGIHYWIPGDPESSSEDLETLVRSCELENGRHEIEAVYCSEQPILFRFDLTDGVARFVEVPS